MAPGAASVPALHSQENPTSAPQGRALPEEHQGGRSGLPELSREVAEVPPSQGQALEGTSSLLGAGAWTPARPWLTGQIQVSF